MAARKYPTMLGRRLGGRLRQLRQERGLSGEQVAARLDETRGRWSESKLNRLELGLVSTTQGDVTDLLDLYEVPDGPLRDELIALARESRQKRTWDQYKDVSLAPFDPYLDLESSARSVRTFQNQLIPGPLQTADYARAVIRSVRNNATAAELDRGVELRQARREALTRAENPLALWAILGQEALVRPVGGPSVMREQLQFLAALFENEEKLNATIQVIPYSAGEHLGMDAPFTLIQFNDPAAPNVVYLEQLRSALYLEEPDEVESYTMFYERLQADASSPRDSSALIAQTARDM